MTEECLEYVEYKLIQYTNSKASKGTKLQKSVNIPLKIIVKSL